MPASPRERGLLFGLTALQFNFITRDRLLEVAAPWMADARGDLGSILLERGYIKPDQHAAVSAMVAAQLNSHGGDGRASIASAPLDATLRATLRALDPSAAAPEPPPSGGSARYRLGTELGRGGLGRVVEAFDPELKRDVAIKLVLDTLAPDARDRFVREAELTARLEHPNIVPVHDFGALENGGKRELFLCMKRVRGRDLGKLLEAMARGDRPSKRAYTRARLLRIFQDLCLGVAFAHDRGVVHRDLKPSNVMIGDYGETLIVDWGLARVLAGQPPADSRGGSAGSGSAAALTLQGELVGTPMYMSPEQAEGRIDDVDTRSDIWALGAILYEILTFRPPFEGKTVDEILSKVKSGRITPPSEIAPPAAVRAPADLGRTVIAAPSTRSFREPVPPELDAICLKALAVKKEDRFQSAMDLHEDIQAYLEGVKERERKSRAVDAALRRAKEAMEQLRQLSAAADAASMHADEVRHATIFDADRSPFWKAQDQAEQAGQEAARAYSRLENILAGALAIDADHPEVRRARAGLAWDAFCRAEQRRDERQAIIHRAAVEEYGAAEYAERLRFGGRVTFETRAFPCACLRDGRSVGPEELWSGNLHLLSGRDTECLADHCVPELEPAGPRRWKVHGSDCAPVAIEGADVWAFRYVQEGRLLIPSTPADDPRAGTRAPDPSTLDSLFGTSPFRPRGPGLYLGTTPLRDLPMACGSWLLVVSTRDRAPLRATLEVRRSEDARLCVTLWRPDEIPEDYVPVAEGIAYEDVVQDASWRTFEMPAFFMRRMTVTCREYARFLNEIAVTDRAKASRLRPRSATGPLWPDDPFRIPARGDRAFRSAFADTEVDWQEEWPVTFVSWKDALEFAGWCGSRSGHLVTLPLDMEYVRAFRGSDRRRFPWGNDWSVFWANSNAVPNARAAPCDAREFPHDESPTGIRALGGNVRTWCLDGLGKVRPEWRMQRGGYWQTAPDRAHVANRAAQPPDWTGPTTGFRLVIHPGTRL